MITLAPLLLYQDEFIDEMVFSLFHKKDYLTCNRYI